MGMSMMMDTIQDKYAMVNGVAIQGSELMMDCLQASGIDVYKTPVTVDKDQVSDILPEMIHIMQTLEITDASGETIYVKNINDMANMCIAFLMFLEWMESYSDVATVTFNTDPMNE